MLSTIILFLLGFILITKGADIFIESTVSVAKKSNIPEIILGATIVSLATTFPELTVSLFASIKGHTTMSLGNAIGSIICNTGLVLGVVAIIKPFKVSKDSFNSKAIILLLSVIALITLGLDKSINRIDSIVLMMILFIYMIDNLKNISNPGVKNIGKVKLNSNHSFKEWFKTIMYFTLGISMMIIGSRFLVNNGIKIAQFMGIPQSVISLTVIALGTSLPELVSCLTAIRKNHNAISVGNILGANILNIVSVIAFSAFINEIPILKQTSVIDFPFMILLLLILIIPIFIKEKIFRWQGIAMLATYICYITTLYFTYK